MTGLYSINLRVMGRANLSLLGKSTIDNLLQKFNLPSQFDTIFIGLFIAVFVISALVLFFRTELGQALIATGDNEIMARSLGISTNKTKILGLMLSNGLIAFAGALIAQDDGYADISKGVGTIVIGLASVIIGEVVFGNLSFKNRLVCVILGSIIYRLIIMFVLFIAFVICHAPTHVGLRDIWEGVPERSEKFIAMGDDSSFQILSESEARIIWRREASVESWFILFAS